MAVEAAAVAVATRSWTRRTAMACLLFVPSIVVAPALLFVGVTFLHESAHALMTLALGGTVSNFSFLPGAHDLGHTGIAFPPGTPSWEGALVSVAPYLMWSGFAAVAIVIAFLPVRMNRWIGATFFYWFYFVPLSDIAWNLYSGRGDLAIGGLDQLVLDAVGTALLLGAWVIGWFVQRRLLRDDAVDALGYVAGCFVVGAASAVAAVLGLAAFTYL